MKNIRKSIIIWNVFVFVIMIFVTKAVMPYVDINGKSDAGEPLSLYFILLITYLTICLLSNLILWILGVHGIIKTNFTLDKNINEDSVYTRVTHSSLRYKHYVINYREKVHKTHYGTDIIALIPFFSIFSFITEDDYIDDEIMFAVNINKTSSNYNSICVELVGEITRRFEQYNKTLSDRFVENKEPNVYIMDANAFTPEKFREEFKCVVDSLEIEYNQMFEKELCVNKGQNTIDHYLTETYIGNRYF